MIPTLVVLHLAIAAAYVLIGLYLAPRFVIVGSHLGAQIARVCLGTFFVGCALTHIHDAQHIQALVEAHDNAWAGAPYLIVHGVQAVCGWAFFFLARRFLSFRIYNKEHYDAAVDDRVHVMVENAAEAPPLAATLGKVLEAIDESTTPRDQLNQIIVRLESLEADRAQVAENLVVAQTAVDGVAADLATAQTAVDGVATDLAARSVTYRGEPMSPAPIFTEAVIKADGQSRVAKTAGQAGVATAIVIVGEYVAHQIGWNGELTTEVSGSITLLLTAIGAWLTNLGRLRGEA